MNITKEFTDKPVSMTITLIGLATFILNAWFAVKVVPFLQDIDRLNSRIAMIEQLQQDRAIFIERFLIVEQKVEQDRRDILEIKASQIRIEGKLDRLIERGL